MKHCHPPPPRRPRPLRRVRGASPARSSGRGRCLPPRGWGKRHAAAPPQRARSLCQQPLRKSVPRPTPRQSRPCLGAATACGGVVPSKRHRTRQAGATGGATPHQERPRERTRRGGDGEGRRRLKAFPLPSRLC
eukprot:scaffold19940_cov124-Isochrysis_galbana.AAC.7